MKKFALALLVTAMTAPAFANTEAEVTIVDPNQDAVEQALEMGLTPADMLDSSEFQQENTEALLLQRDPRDRRPVPRRQFLCQARDRQGYVWQSRDWDLNRARREAVYKCERQSRNPRSCRLLGCR